ncbi:uncharacterized protein LOC143175077 isoform X2 [Nomia melanderi]|uniref:uncharacterized protein LOC143175077 isoform X2 n=1 Tax=Nomia melanderi TaxID=2448451 RepID=UPI003FCE16FA
MKSILRFNELWGYVNGTIIITEANAAEWAINDEKAFDLIILSLHKTQFNHVKRAAPSLEAWDALKNVHESKGPMRQCVLYKQLYRMKIPPNQSITQYVNDFIHKIEQLAESRIKLPDTVLPIILLMSLLSEYKTFSIANESREKMPTLEDLKVKLLEVEIRKVDNNLFKENTYNSKYSVKCYLRGKVGRPAKYCKNKKRFITSRSSEKDAMIAQAYSAISMLSNEWCLDSGATAHMNKDKGMFNSFHEGLKDKLYDLMTSGKVQTLIYIIV